jgi:hypothetical protein
MTCGCQAACDEERRIVSEMQTIRRGVRTNIECQVTVVQFIDQLLIGDILNQASPFQFFVKRHIYITPVFDSSYFINYSTKRRFRQSVFQKKPKKAEKADCFSVFSTAFFHSVLHFEKNYGILIPISEDKYTRKEKDLL